jgi:tripartite-type tricarboxylate transporter receptor subunit TctC
MAARNLFQRAGAAALLSTALVSAGALAQSTGAFPSKPVTMVIPFAPGGPVDIEGRRHAAKMTELMGQNFLLDFKPGAGETIGAAFVARAPADGYTVLVGSASFTINPFLYSNLPYDVLRDFAPVSLVSQRASLLLAHPSLPAKNIQELIAYARANPDKLNWGTTGAGTISHLSGAWFQNAAGVKATFVHYKGAGPAQIDLLAGRTDLGSLTVLASLPLLKSGKVKALGTLSSVRSKILPDLPSIEEQGVPGYNASSWFGILAPAATPAAVINRLSEGFAKAVRSPDVATPLEAEGIALVGSTPVQFRQMLAGETERWRKVVQENGIKLDQ